MAEKQIIFTVHAQERMQQRGITQDEIINLLQDPTAYEVVSDGAKKRYSATLVVIYQPTNEKVVVLTTYPREVSLEIKVKEIAGKIGWYKEESLDSFIKEAYYMESLGVSENEIVKHLQTLFDAVCNEFTK